MRRLFILRPEPGASASAERARRLGMEPVVVPLFQVEPVEWALPGPADAFDALLLTSANAPRFAGPALQALAALPAHAVGDATADAARAAGLRVASVGSAGVEQLLGRLDPALRLLHLCGTHRRGADGSAQSILPVAVYRSAERDVGRALDALDGEVAALHSPRAAERLAELVPPDRRRSVRIAAISPAAAAAAGQGWERVRPTPQPGDEALLALARRLCEDAPDDE